MTHEPAADDFEQRVVGGAEVDLFDDDEAWIASLLEAAERGMEIDGCRS